ncbi:hypothetical protein [Actinomadura rudentiformis]|nr:hypothetical protein [Actinomadura rudentiformis]
MKHRTTGTIPATRRGLIDLDLDLDLTPGRRDRLDAAGRPS